MEEEEEAREGEEDCSPRSGSLAQSFSFSSQKFFSCTSSDLSSALLLKPTPQNGDGEKVGLVSHQGDGGDFGKESGVLSPPSSMHCQIQAIRLASLATSSSSPLRGRSGDKDGADRRNTSRYEPVSPRGISVVDDVLRGGTEDMLLRTSHMSAQEVETRRTSRNGIPSSLQEEDSDWRAEGSEAGSLVSWEMVGPGSNLPANATLSASSGLHHTPWLHPSFASRVSMPLHGLLPLDDVSGYRSASLLEEEEEKASSSSCPSHVCPSPPPPTIPAIRQPLPLQAPSPRDSSPVESEGSSAPRDVDDGQPAPRPRHFGRRGSQSPRYPNAEEAAAAAAAAAAALQDIPQFRVGLLDGEQGGRCGKDGRTRRGGEERDLPLGRSRNDWREERRSFLVDKEEPADGVDASLPLDVSGYSISSLSRSSSSSCFLSSSILSAAPAGSPRRCPCHGRARGRSEESEVRTRRREQLRQQRARTTGQQGEGRSSVDVEEEEETAQFVLALASSSSEDEDTKRPHLHSTLCMPRGATIAATEEEGKSSSPRNPSLLVGKDQSGGERDRSDHVDLSAKQHARREAQQVDTRTSSSNTPFDGSHSTEASADTGGTSRSSHPTMLPSTPVSASLSLSPPSPPLKAFEFSSPLLTTVPPTISPLLSLPGFSGPAGFAASLLPPPYTQTVPSLSSSSHLSSSPSEESKERQASSPCSSSSSPSSQAEETQKSLSPKAARTNSSFTSVLDDSAVGASHKILTSFSSCSSVDHTVLALGSLPPSALPEEQAAAASSAPGTGREESAEDRTSSGKREGGPRAGHSSFAERPLELLKDERHSTLPLPQSMLADPVSQQSAPSMISSSSAAVLSSSSSSSSVSVIEHHRQVSRAASCPSEESRKARDERVGEPVPPAPPAIPFHPATSVFPLPSEGGEERIDKQYRVAPCSSQEGESGAGRFGPPSHAPPLVRVISAEGGEGERGESTRRTQEAAAPPLGNNDSALSSVSSSSSAFYLSRNTQANGSTSFPSPRGFEETQKKLGYERRVGVETSASSMATSVQQHPRGGGGQERQDPGSRMSRQGTTEGEGGGSTRTKVPPRTEGGGERITSTASLQPPPPQLPLGRILSREEVPLLSADGFYVEEFGESLQHASLFPPLDPHSTFSRSVSQQQRLPGASSSPFGPEEIPLVATHIDSLDAFVQAVEQKQKEEEEQRKMRRLVTTGGEADGAEDFLTDELLACPCCKRRFVKWRHARHLQACTKAEVGRQALQRRLRLRQQQQKEKEKNEVASGSSSSRLTSSSGNPIMPSDTKKSNRKTARASPPSTTTTASSSATGISSSTTSTSGSTSTSTSSSGGSSAVATTTTGTTTTSTPSNPRGGARPTGAGAALPSCSSREPLSGTSLSLPGSLSKGGDLQGQEKKSNSNNNNNQKSRSLQRNPDRSGEGGGGGDGRTGVAGGGGGPGGGPRGVFVAKDQSAAKPPGTEIDGSLGQEKGSLPKKEGGGDGGGGGGVGIAQRRGGAGKTGIPRVRAGNIKTPRPSSSVAAGGEGDEDTRANRSAKDNNTSYSGSSSIRMPVFPRSRLTDADEREMTRIPSLSEGVGGGRRGRKPGQKLDEDNDESMVLKVKESKVIRASTSPVGEEAAGGVEGTSYDHHGCKGSDRATGEALPSVQGFGPEPTTTTPQDKRKEGGGPGEETSLSRVVLSRTDEKKTAANALSVHTEKSLSCGQQQNSQGSFLPGLQMRGGLGDPNDTRKEGKDTGGVGGSGGGAGEVGQETFPGDRRADEADGKRRRRSLSGLQDEAAPCALSGKSETTVQEDKRRRTRSDSSTPSPRSTPPSRERSRMLRISSSGGRAGDGIGGKDDDAGSEEATGFRTPRGRNTFLQDLQSERDSGPSDSKQLFGPVSPVDSSSSSSGDRGGDISSFGSSCPRQRGAEHSKRDVDGVVSPSSCARAEGFFASAHEQSPNCSSSSSPPCSGCEAPSTFIASSWSTKGPPRPGEEQENQVADAVHTPEDKPGLLSSSSASSPTSCVMPEEKRRPGDEESSSRKRIVECGLISSSSGLEHPAFSPREEDGGTVGETQRRKSPHKGLGDGETTRKESDLLRESIRAPPLSADNRQPSFSDDGVEEKEKTREEEEEDVVVSFPPVCSRMSSLANERRDDIVRGREYNSKRRREVLRGADDRDNEGALTVSAEEEEDARQGNGKNPTSQQGSGSCVRHARGGEDEDNKTTRRGPTDCDPDGVVERSEDEKEEEEEDKESQLTRGRRGSHVEAGGCGEPTPGAFRHLQNRRKDDDGEEKEAFDRLDGEVDKTLKGVSSRDGGGNVETETGKKGREKTISLGVEQPCQANFEQARPFRDPGFSRSHVDHETSRSASPRRHGNDDQNGDYNKHHRKSGNRQEGEEIYFVSLPPHEAGHFRESPADCHGSTSKEGWSSSLLTCAALLPLKESGRNSERHDGTPFNPDSFERAFHRTHGGEETEEEEGAVSGTSRNRQRQKIMTVHPAALLRSAPATTSSCPSCEEDTSVKEFSSSSGSVAEPHSSFSHSSPLPPATARQSCARPGHIGTSHEARRKPDAGHPPSSRLAPSSFDPHCGRDDHPPHPPSSPSSSPSSSSSSSSASSLSPLCSSSRSDGRQELAVSLSPRGDGDGASIDRPSEQRGLQGATHEGGRGNVRKGKTEKKSAEEVRCIRVQQEKKMEGNNTRDLDDRHPPRKAHPPDKDAAEDNGRGDPNVGERVEGEEKHEVLGSGKSTPKKESLRHSLDKTERQNGPDERRKGSHGRHASAATTATTTTTSTAAARSNRNTKAGKEEGRRTSAAKRAPSTKKTEGKEDFFPPSKTKQEVGEDKDEDGEKKSRQVSPGAKGEATRKPQQPQPPQGSRSDPNRSASSQAGGSGGGNHHDEPGESLPRRHLFKGVRPENRWKLQPSKACPFCQRSFCTKSYDNHVKVCESLRSARSALHPKTKKQQGIPGGSMKSSPPGIALHATGLENKTPLLKITTYEGAKSTAPKAVPKGGMISRTAKGGGVGGETGGVYTPDARASQCGSRHQACPQEKERTSSKRSHAVFSSSKQNAVSLSRGVQQDHVEEAKRGGSLECMLHALTSGEDSDLLSFDPEKNGCRSCSVPPVRLSGSSYHGEEADASLDRGEENAQLLERLRLIERIAHQYTVLRGPPYQDKGNRSHQREETAAALPATAPPPPPTQKVSCTSKPKPKVSSPPSVIKQRHEGDAGDARKKELGACSEEVSPRAAENPQLEALGVFFLRLMMSCRGGGGRGGPQLEKERAFLQASEEGRTGSRGRNCLRRRDEVTSQRRSGCLHHSGVSESLGGGDHGVKRRPSNGVVRGHCGGAQRGNRSLPPVRKSEIGCRDSEVLGEDDPSLKYLADLPGASDVEILRVIAEFLRTRHQKEGNENASPSTRTLENYVDTVAQVREETERKATRTSKGSEVGQYSGKMGSSGTEGAPRRNLETKELPFPRSHGRSRPPYDTSVVSPSPTESSPTGSRGPWRRKRQEELSSQNVSAHTTPQGAEECSQITTPAVPTFTQQYKESFLLSGPIGNHTPPPSQGSREGRRLKCPSSSVKARPKTSAQLAPVVAQHSHGERVSGEENEKVALKKSSTEEAFPRASTPQRNAMRRIARLRDVSAPAVPSEGFDRRDCPEGQGKYDEMNLPSAKSRKAAADRFEPSEETLALVGLSESIGGPSWPQPQLRVAPRAPTPSRPQGDTREVPEAHQRQELRRVGGRSVVKSGGGERSRCSRSAIRLLVFSFQSTRGAHRRR